MSDPDIRVLSTRPLSGVLVEIARSKGVVIDIIPMIETAATADDELLRALKQHRLTAVFTSANAVWAVGGGGDWKVYCLSGATRRAVAEKFGEEAIAGVADSAAQLGQKIVEDAVRSVVFFCGDLRREELPAIFRQAGVGYRDIIVYKTTATPKKVGNKYDGILFFSPSAVESYLSVNGVPDGTVLFAIGPTTAAALEGHNVIVSNQPDASALIDKVIEHFQNKI